MKNKRLLENLAELARSQYVKCIDLAMSDDFANPKLMELHQKVLANYNKYINKPLKRLKIFVYAAGTIYNKELVYNVDNKLCFNLNILALIVHNKLYTINKLNTFWNSFRPSDWIRFGWRPKIDIELKYKMFGGINVTNS